jgi:hypothetical protein
MQHVHESRITCCKSLNGVTPRIVETDTCQTQILADDIGRQIMWFKQRFSGEELCTRIDALSAADLQRVAQRLLSTAPSIAVYAPQAYLDKVPDYDSFADYIKAHLAQK